MKVGSALPDEPALGSADATQPAGVPSSRLPAAPWDGAFSDEELASWRRGGYGRRGATSGRPALLVVDVVRGFTGYEGESLAEGQERFRQCCGPYAWAAIPAIVNLVARFRECDWPIIFTRAGERTGPSTIQRAKNERAGATSAATRRLADAFLPELQPTERDVVIDKPRPSAFFQTQLLELLEREKVNWLTVTGCTTSGCIRATVNDGFANDVPMVIPHEAVFDRFPTSHRVNLFDMNAKYADVISVTELLEELSDAAR